MSFRAAETHFHEEASRACGLDDFGDDDYLEGLRALLAALDDEAPLNEIGHAMFRTNIVAALVGRLHSEHGWSTHPEHAEAAIDGPLVIMGLPRTGTTALQHLLAQDPSLQALELWISTSPKPRVPRARWQEDPDFRACDERMRMLHANSPDLMAIHPMAADLPDECWHLTTQHFAHSGYEAQTHVPSYSRWWEGYDMGPAWRRHRKNLQLIGYREPERRWLLKDATYLFHLDAFMGVYPDARVVMTHRDPVQLIPSVCSLCWALRSPTNENLDKIAFGRAELDLWDRAIHIAMRAREALDPAQFYDQHFKTFQADPLASIRDIYRHFDLHYDEAADAAIRAFRSQNPPGKHGAHSYTLEEWGLEAGEIRERFADYCELYGVESEP